MRPASWTSPFTTTIHVKPSSVPDGLAAVAQELVEHLGRDAAELPALLAAVQDGHFEIALGEGLVLGDHEGAHAELDRGREVQPLLVVVLEVAPDLVGLSAHGRVVLLVLDGAVVEDVVDLVLGAVRIPDLDD